MRRSIIGMGACAAATCVLAVAALAPAGAASVRAQAAVVRDCATSLVAGSAAGVAERRWRAPADGLLTARLEGGATPDWDLAIFRPGEPRALAASTSVTSDELAKAWVSAGDRLTIQACRRAGGAAAVPLSLDFVQLARPAPTDGPTSLATVPISGPEDVARLEQLGIDVTEDVSVGAATVVLHSDADRALLASAGFESRTLITDLEAANTADRRAEQLTAQRRGRSGLPSGRNTYRHYSDYTTELKALADDNPGFVRSIVLGQTVDERPIEGVEIAAGVNRTDDGRPVYLNIGLHHAREWPSGEFPMEFAIDLVNGFNGDDPRIRALLRRVRVVIVPVVNADGFIVSRDTAAGEFKRKNCRPTLGDEALPCEARSVLSGVDLNRNYGAYWGGAGSSSSPSSEIYRGPEPYSEPEAEAVHRFSSRIQPTVLITNHTFTSQGTWLRQPGFTAVVSSTPDEPAMKSLGDAMADATGWLSQRAWKLGEITGATEDWNYFAQGTYGYTPEARGPDFHGNFGDMVVGEYLGDAAHPGLGVREAFLIAGERAANRADHSVLTGSGPAGAKLSLRKAFVTPTSQGGVNVSDVLRTTLTVPTSGHYRWDVNPSSRPLVPGEKWRMVCSASGGGRGVRNVAVARGERVTVDWGAGCAEIR